MDRPDLGSIDNLKEQSEKLRETIAFQREDNPWIVAKDYEKMLIDFKIEVNEYITYLENEIWERTHKIRHCTDCDYIGNGLASKVSCVRCGCRYEPCESDEKCPECCENGDYESHCPNCDSTAISGNYVKIQIV
jgi:methionyl-tRNA synthetase